MAEGPPSGVLSPSDPPTSSEGALAAAKASFDKLVAKQAAEPDLNKPFPEQATPNKKAKPKAPQKPQEAASEPEAVEAVAEEKPAVEAPKKRSEADRLRAKLLLAGNPKKAIDSLSDEDVGEWWKKQEEREQATASALQRASDLEKQIKSPETSEKSEPLAGVPTDDLDLDEIKSSLADQFGEEEATALANVLSAVLAPIQQENREIKTILENARKHGVQQIEKSNRERLGDKLAMLKTNDRAWAMLTQAVHEELKKDPKKHSSAEAVFDDVFESVYGDVITEAAPTSAPEEDKAEEKARIAASSHTPPSSAKRQRSFTPMDAHKAAFEHLLKNPEDTEGARRSYGRYTVQ